MDQTVKESSSDENKHDKDRSCYSYEGSTCIYTDPSTHQQYEWCEEEKNWIQRSSRENKEKEASVCTRPKFSVDESDRDYVYDGETYVYTDKKDGMKYSWNSKTNEWVKISEKEVSKVESVEDASSLVAELKTGVYDTANDRHYYTDPNDGTVYEWDNEKNAWFPKVDEEFIAHYQMSYGFNQGVSGTKTEEKSNETKASSGDVESDKNSLKRKEPPPPPAWFDVDDKHNTKVYVSNLPCDLTETEFVDLMQKCGLIMKDPDTNRMKVKLYVDPEGTFKGDALCTYIKIESVELALNLLDGKDVKGRKIRVERAKFQMKGQAYDASLKPRKKRKRDKEKLKKMQEKLFDWRPDKMRGERPGNERVVVIKNLFEPGLFDKNAALLLEYKEDLREECSKCGNLRKVAIHDRHPEGVAQVYFEDAEEADICVKLLNGRWFGQRRLVAETWDGKTKYRVEETEEEKEKRLQNWAKFLESGEGGPSGVDGSTDPVSSKADAEIKDVTSVSAGKDDENASAGKEIGTGLIATHDQNVVVCARGARAENRGDSLAGNINIGSETSHHSRPNDGHSKDEEIANKSDTGNSVCHDNGRNDEDGLDNVPEDEGETDSNPEGDSD